MSTASSLPDEPDDRLPIDPDVGDEPRADRPRALHGQPAAIAVVFAGGAIGTALRESLVLAFPAQQGVPFTVLAINVVGAFLLGLLLEALTRRGPDEGIRRSLRLLLGTGVLGGFTTYSALEADSALLLGSDAPLVGAAYALATVTIGAAASWAGIALGRTIGLRGRARA